MCYKVVRVPADGPIPMSIVLIGLSELFKRKEDMKLGGGCVKEGLKWSQGEDMDMTKMQRKQVRNVHRISNIYTNIHCKRWKYKEILFRCFIVNINTIVFP